MSTPAPRRRPPYVRPMQGWWKRDPYFVRYMVRETTAIGVAAYALVLVFGVFRLGQGAAAWNGWLAALRSPLSLLLHAVLLVAFAVHAVTWFQIMPKTLPMIHLGGRRLPASAIIAAGFVAVAVVTVAMLALAVWGAP